MLDSIPLDSIGIGSGWMLAALAVVGLIRGDIISRKFYVDVIEASKAKDAQILELQKQLALSLEVGRTVQEVLTAIHNLAGRDR